MWAHLGVGAGVAVGALEDCVRSLTARGGAAALGVRKGAQRSTRHLGMVDELRGDGTVAQDTGELEGFPSVGEAAASEIVGVPGTSEGQQRLSV